MEPGRGILIAASLLFAAQHDARALEREFDTPGGTMSMEWLNIVSAGASWRMQKRTTDLVGKANLEANRELCAPDDCIGLSPGQTEPNERFLAAPGQLASFTDDGNLNYDRGDIVFATAKWHSRLHLDWGWFGIRTSGLYFFDAVNHDFDESRPNIILDPGPQPGVASRVARSRQARDDVGRDFQLRDLNLWLRVPTWGDQQAELRIGRQIMTWGVATFGIATNLNIINPADLNALVRPGAELYELFSPQNMVTLQAGITDNLGVDAWYQLEWRPYGFPAKGSFFSFFDAGNRPEPNESIALPFSKVPDDPQQIGTPANPLLAAVSATSFSALRAPNREPPDSGQFGVSLYRFFENASGGTEIGLHFASYHSRLPSASFVAADASCTRREGNANNRDTANLLQFLADCGIPFVDTPGEDFEALPLDTAQYFLDYARDIRLFGLSFNTTLLGANLHGELTWRPNHPVQVDLEDLFFAALQPVFPRNEIVIIPDGTGNLLDLPVLGPILGALPGLGPLPPPGVLLGGATLTDSRTAIPDFVTAYRGGTPGEVEPGSIIRGYERMSMWQLSLGFLRLWGHNFLPAVDQFGWLFEINAIWLPDLPNRNALQLEGPGTFTHASPGIAETGNGLLINPQQQNGGWVTGWSGGYRTGMMAIFNDVFLPGLMLRPTVVLMHDVHGVAPGLAENHLEGRIMLLNELAFRYRGFGLDLQYGVFTGAGNSNVLRDRDMFSATLSYNF